MNIAKMNKTINCRRRMLAGLGLAAGALPARWVQPAMNVVVLPAHAQTTSTLSNNAQSACSPVGTWTIKDTRAEENDPGAVLVLDADNTGIYGQTESVVWSYSPGVGITLNFSFDQSSAQLTGSMSSDCNLMSGGWANDGAAVSGSWEASRTQLQARSSLLAKRRDSAFR